MHYILNTLGVIALAVILSAIGWHWVALVIVSAEAIGRCYLMWRFIELFEKIEQILGVDIASQLTITVEEAEKL